MSIVKIENLSHTTGGKQLYQGVELFVNRGEHIALVGINGAGKTTLLNLISGQHGLPDEGTIEISPKAKMGYLDQHQEIAGDQTVRAYLQSNYADLFAKDAEINRLYAEMSENYEEKLLLKALKLQKELEYSGFDLIDQKINRLVDGLGIEPANMDKNINELSGGQKGKVMLAKLFLSEADFLLLDEPTNFLDIEQVKWLAKFLQSYPGAYLMVSHDRNFINLTCNIIYDIDNRTITRYVGNYEKFLEQKALISDQYAKEYVSQQRTIKKLETFIAKNAARASTARMAQSRQKQLDKIDVMDKQHQVGKPNFKFRYRRPSTNVPVRAQDLMIGYNQALLKKPLNFEIKLGEKCIIKGHNGIGKTTFLKTVAQEIKPISGTCQLGANVTVGFFHQTEEVPNVTPIQFLHEHFPDMTDKEIRATLAAFGVKNTLMVNNMPQLSGGEQTKVRLSLLSLTPCSMLVLDEPTNHIDTLAKESLLEAIQQFEGTVLMTTHDINFSTAWVDNELNFEKMF